MFYFLHISKCAGSTFVRHASRNIRLFPNNANGNPVSPITGHQIPYWNWAPDEQQYLLSRSTYDFVANEVYLGNQFSFFDPVTYVVILRDPLDRILSHFLWLFRDAIGSRTSTREIGDMFVRFYQSSTRFQRSANYMTTALTAPLPRSKTVEDANARLEMAKERLRNFDELFFVENLNGDLKRMQRYGWKLQRTSMKKRKGRVTDMRAALALHPEVLAELVARNHCDLELYRFARGLRDVGERRTAGAPPRKTMDFGQDGPVPESQSPDFLLLAAYDAYLAKQMPECCNLVAKAYAVDSTAGENNVQVYVAQTLERFASPLRKQTLRGASTVRRKLQLARLMGERRRSWLGNLFSFR